MISFDGYNFETVQGMVKDAYRHGFANGTLFGMGLIMGIVLLFFAAI